MTVLLQQHLKDLLTHSDLDNHQGQGFQERLMEGHRLAEHLAHKLSPGKGATVLDSTELLQGPLLTRDSTPALGMFFISLPVSCPVWGYDRSRTG